MADQGSERLTTCIMAHCFSFSLSVQEMGWTDSIRHCITGVFEGRSNRCIAEKRTGGEEEQRVVHDERAI